MECDERNEATKEKSLFLLKTSAAYLHGSPGAERLSLSLSGRQMSVEASGRGPVASRSILYGPRALTEATPVAAGEVAVGVLTFSLPAQSLPPQSLPPQRPSTRRRRPERVRSKEVCVEKAGPAEEESFCCLSAATTAQESMVPLRAFCRGGRGDADSFDDTAWEDLSLGGQSLLIQREALSKQPPLARRQKKYEDRPEVVFEKDDDDDDEGERLSKQKLQRRCCGSLTPMLLPLRPFSKTPAAPPLALRRPPPTRDLDDDFLGKQSPQQHIIAPFSIVSLPSAPPSAKKTDNLRPQPPRSTKLIAQNAKKTRNKKNTPRTTTKEKKTRRKNNNCEDLFEECSCTILTPRPPPSSLRETNKTNPVGSLEVGSPTLSANADHSLTPLASAEKKDRSDLSDDQETLEVPKEASSASTLTLAVTLQSPVEARWVALEAQRPSRTVVVDASVAYLPERRDCRLAQAGLDLNWTMRTLSQSRTNALTKDSEPKSPLAGRLYHSPFAMAPFDTKERTQEVPQRERPVAPQGQRRPEDLADLLAGIDLHQPTADQQRATLAGRRWHRWPEATIATEPMTSESPMSTRAYQTLPLPARLHKQTSRSPASPQQQPTKQQRQLHCYIARPNTVVSDDDDDDDDDDRSDFNSATIESS